MRGQMKRLENLHYSVAAPIGWLYRTKPEILAINGVIDCTQAIVHSSGAISPLIGQVTRQRVIPECWWEDEL